MSGTTKVLYEDVQGSVRTQYGRLVSGSFGTELIKIKTNFSTVIHFTVINANDSFSFYIVDSKLPKEGGDIDITVFVGSGNNTAIYKVEGF